MTPPSAAEMLATCFYCGLPVILAPGLAKFGWCHEDSGFSFCDNEGTYAMPAGNSSGGTAADSPCLRLKDKRRGP